MSTTYREEDTLSWILACEYAARAMPSGSQQTEFYARAKELEAQAKSGFVPMSPDWLPGTISHGAKVLADDIASATGVNPLDMQDTGGNTEGTMGAAENTGGVTTDPQFSHNLADNLEGNGRDIADAAKDDIDAVKKAAAAATDTATKIAKTIFYALIALAIVVVGVLVYPYVRKAQA